MKTLKMRAQLRCRSNLCNRIFGLNKNQFQWDSSLVGNWLERSLFAHCFGLETTFPCCYYQVPTSIFTIELVFECIKTENHVEKGYLPCHSLEEVEGFHGCLDVGLE